MGSIIVNIGGFNCEEPIVGTTYRYGKDYRFNYSSKGDLYTSYGMNVTMKLFYGLDGNSVTNEYVAQIMPFNANNFFVNQIPEHDIASFRIEFSVNNGNTCFYSINIPFSSIIIVN